MTTDSIAANGRVDRPVREAWCPVCLGNRPSLPAPAEGTCSHCYNHLMKPCQDCTHYYSGSIGEMHVGMPCCKGDPEGRKYDWNWARRNDNLCGSMGAWASFPNATLCGSREAGNESAAG